MAVGVDAVLLVARVLFGGVLAFVGLNHFLQTEAMAGYAGAKGLPAPRLATLASGGLLVAGGLGIVLGVLPAVSALAVAAPSSLPPSRARRGRSTPASPCLAERRRRSRFPAFPEPVLRLSRQPGVSRC